MKSEVASINLFHFVDDILPIKVWWCHWHCHWRWFTPPTRPGATDWHDCPIIKNIPVHWKTSEFVSFSCSPLWDYGDNEFLYGKNNSLQFFEHWRCEHFVHTHHWFSYVCVLASFPRAFYNSLSFVRYIFKYSFKVFPRVSLAKACIILNMLLWGWRNQSPSTG